MLTSPPLPPPLPKVVFLGLIRDLFADVVDAMPRMRKRECEALIKEVADEGGLQASDYFVQNVVDLEGATPTHPPPP